MSIKINTNPASLRAIELLAKNTSALRTTQERLASGSRINNASDDAAGLGVAMALNAKARVYTQGIRNINDATSVVNVASSAVDALSTIVTRQLELAQQAANGTYTSKQREGLDREALALSAEYNRIIQSTEFNGRYLFRDGPSTINVQAGYGDSGAIPVEIGSKIASSLIGTGTFGTLLTVDLNGVPTGSVAADVNNDGNMDYLRGDNNASNTMVYLGNGDGTFQAGISRTWPQTLYVTSTAADVNNDGFVDLIGTRDPGNVAVFIGNGNGTFQAAVEYAAPGGYGAETGDFDNDGDLDIMSTSGPNGQLGVLLNNGNGTFTVGTSIAVSGRNLTFADFNEDNNLDFVVSGVFQDGGNAVYLGNGNGTFTVNPGGTVNPPNGQWTYATDFDQDGNMDFLSITTLGIIYAVRGDGAGGFSTVSTTDSGISGTLGSDMAVYMSDNNRDGYLDVTVASMTEIKTYFADGQGDFSLAGVSSPSPGTGNVRGIVAADYNNDDVADLIWDELGTGNRYLYLADTTMGSLQQDLDLTTQSGARSTISLLNNTLSLINQEKGVLGAQLSRLDVAKNVLTTTVERYRAAESIIRDVDIAQEAANLARLRIAQQIATQVLSVANMQPKLILQLLNED